MADVSLVSNEASPLKKMLGSVSQQNPFVYSARSSIPNFARSRVTIRSEGTPAFNTSHRFAIPRYGLLSSAYLIYEIEKVAGAATTAARVVTPWVGCHLQKKIELMNHNKAVECITSLGLQWWASYGHDESKRLALEEAMQKTPSGDWTGTNADTTKKVPGSSSTGFADGIRVLVPCPFSCFQSASSFLDSRFCEQLDVVVETCSSAADITDQADGFTIKKLSLVCEFISLEDPVYRQLQSQNYKTDSPLSQLLHSEFEEADHSLEVAETTYAAGADVPSSAAFILKKELKVVQLVSHTYFAVRQDTLRGTAIAGNSGAYLGKLVRAYKATEYGEYSGTANYNAGVVKVILRASGRVICELSEDELRLMQWGGNFSRYGGGATHVNGLGSGDATIYCLDWSLISGPGFDGGSLSFAQLIAPELEVHMSDAMCKDNSGTGSTSKYTLQIRHRYHQLRSINTADGRIQVGTSL